MAWLPTPERLADAYSDWRWHLAWQYEGHSVVYRLSRGGSPEIFIKLAPADLYPTLPGEAERMRWARAYLPVPEVVELDGDGPVTWLVTGRLPGADGTHPQQLGRPERLVRTLAAGLRRFHEAAPVEACPFDFRLDAALAHARQRLRSGLVVPERDFHPEHRHLSAKAALDVLERARPDAEDVVVCHGDYCPPNILIEDARATGFVDLGELGVADRWWDLAAATWSVTWNLGPGHEDRFLAEYGATADPDRMAYYRLLYDVAC
jgi:kanamycin kinase